jgi:hypothetical protein
VFIAAAFCEDLDAHVMLENEIVRAAIVNANVPKDRFRIRVRFDERRFECESARFDRAPFFAGGRGPGYHCCPCRSEGADCQRKE